MIPPSARRIARNLLQRTGYAALPSGKLDDLRRHAAQGEKAANLGMIPDERLRDALALLPHSQSQLNQDLFVLHRLGWKRGGYFVEFGATDGKTLSNTWLLETRFGWTGVLAEPAQVWRQALQASGRTARLEFDCVWSASGETLTFNETDWAELSTIAAFEGADSHVRTAARRYAVDTVSLVDLLDRHEAPAIVDYLSIDTEGSEYEILAAFDFARYEFRCITVEHNFSDKREAIRSLLVGHGYQRVHEALSQFDDWYVRA